MNISSGMLLGPRSSVVLSPSSFSLVPYNLSILGCPSLSLVVSFRSVLLSSVLSLLLGTSPFSLSLGSSVLRLLLLSSSRRTCLLEGPELAGGHYGGYSVGFSRLLKAHKRVCPPRVKELPREQVHLLLYLSPPLLFPLLLLLFLSLSPFPYPRCAAYRCQPALCPLRFVP